MKRKAAIICPIMEEYTYIHNFLKYYTSHVDARDIYILDFGSSDEYLQNVIGNSVNVIKTDANILDAMELFKAIRKLQTELYNEYEYVIPLDVDEFLCYVGDGGLKKYLANMDKSRVTCRGYEIIHLPFVEDNIVQDEKWIYQRNYWHQNENHYGKTLISKEELDWRIGFHTYSGETPRSRRQYTDQSLFLVHFHKYDYETTIKRHAEWSKKKWSDNTIKNKHNYHYTEQSIDVVNKWYYEPVFKSIIYEIPETIKKNINI